MEDYTIEVKGEVQQIYKVLTKNQDDKMPFEGIEIAKTLSRIPFFRRYFETNSQHFINLCIAQDVVEYPKNTDIYQKEREEGRQRFVYIVLEGRIQVDGKSCCRRELGMLKVFGQLEPVFAIDQRQQRAVCLEQCKLMRIKELPLLKIFSHRDALKKCLHFLNVNRYFQQLSQLQKMQLTLGLTRRSFQKNEILKLQGDGTESVMFFIYGRADVCVRLDMEKNQQYIIDSLEQMSSFGQYQCVSASQTNVKIKGALPGAYYQLNYKEMMGETHKICAIIEEKAAPYPSNENLMFLHNVKTTLKKEEKRAMKKVR